MIRYMERFSLPYPHRYAAAGQIACRIRTYGIALFCLHAVQFLPYLDAAYRVYGISYPARLEPSKLTTRFLDTIF